MTVLVLACAVVFVSLLLIATAGTLVARTIFGVHIVPLLAGGLTAVGLAAAFLVLVTFLSPESGSVATLALLACSATGVVVLGARSMVRAPIAVGLAAAGAAVVSLGFAAHQGGADRFVSAARRFLPWQLPEDNRIPSQLASWLAGDDRPEYLVGDWLPGDRPPLQSGVILIARSILAPLLESGGDIQVTVDFAASVVAQVLWVPAVIALVTALGFSVKVAIASCAFAAVVPTVVLNTVYSWPKLLAAAFVIAAMAVLVAALRGSIESAASLVLAAALSGLSMLAHGGAAFMLPLICVLAFVLLARRSTWAARLRTGGLSLLTAVSIYGPWLLFQRIVSPPGDRLVKWHLAGVVDIDDRSFVRAVIDQYRETDLLTLWANRATNLGHAFSPDVVRSLDLWRDGAVEERLTAEFYDMTVALGLGVLPIGALLIVWIVRTAAKAEDRRTTRAVSILLGALVCTVIWALAMFLPDAAIVHQGSHAWILILLAVPFAWLADEVAWAAAAVAALQAVVSVVMLFRSPLGEPDALPSILAAGALLLFGAIALAPRSRGRARQAGWLGGGSSAGIVAKERSRAMV